MIRQPKKRIIAGQQFSGCLYRPMQPAERSGAAELKPRYN